MLLMNKSLFMKFNLVIFLFAASFVSADESINVSIDSLSNIRTSGALEACGTAVHKSGVKPLIVTVRHADSYYSILTGPKGKWCVVVKRWTFDGQMEASATTLQNPDYENFKTFSVSED